MADEEAETEAIVWSAAIQAARLYRLRGEAYLLRERSAGRSGYITDAHVQDDHELAVALAEKLIPVDAVKTESGRLIRFKLDEEMIESPGIATRTIDGRPTWLEKVPTSSRYIVGVGSARRSRLLRDSLEQADRNALVDLLSQLSVQVRSGQIRLSIEGVGTVSGQSSFEVIRGEIRGFYILDRWVSPDGEYFYSLAICPRDQ
jgi:hypothetical protein